MTTIRRLISICAFISTTVLALRYLNQQSLWYALPVLVLGVMWYRLGTIHMAAAHVGFLSVSILIALDVFENGINLWAILTIHSALAQWDLITYVNRLESIVITKEIEAIARRHLIRLEYVILIGVILSLITLYLQTSISLVGIIICGLVMMVAFSRIIIRLRRDTV